MKEESAQYGSLRWIAELRMNEFGSNPVAVPAGYQSDFQRIWMQLKQPKRDPPEISTNPDRDDLTANYKNYRKTK